jgi:uncharacterized membrane protein YbhN (UPF0104 family)
MMARLGSVVRSPLVRGLFVVLVFAAAAVAVVRRRDEIGEALALLSPATVAGAALAGVAYMVVTMLVWRAVLRDLGSPLPLGPATSLFFVSQLGKYLPGGVWNIAAATEMGVDHQIPRRRSLSVMLVATLISVSTGLALAVAVLPLAPPELAERLGAAFWLLPVFTVVLLPPVLNRLLGLALRLLRRPPLEHPVTGRGVLVAASWSLVAWLLVGLHVWLLATGVGLDRSVETLALATGGYALAWTIGFLVVFVPAGIGVREAVLAAALSNQLDAGALVIVVLLSRAVLTLIDLLLGAVGLLVRRRR